MHELIEAKRARETLNINIKGKHYYTVDGWFYKLIDNEPYQWSFEEKKWLKLITAMGDK